MPFLKEIELFTKKLVLLTLQMNRQELQPYLSTSCTQATLKMTFHISEIGIIYYFYLSLSIEKYNILIVITLEVIRYNSLA